MLLSLTRRVSCKEQNFFASIPACTDHAIRMIDMQQKKTTFRKEEQLQRILLKIYSFAGDKFLLLPQFTRLNDAHL